MKLVLALCLCTVLAVSLRFAYALSRQARDVPERCSAFITDTIAAASSTEYVAQQSSSVAPQ